MPVNTHQRKCQPSLKQQSISQPAAGSACLVGARNRQSHVWSERKNRQRHVWSDAEKSAKACLVGAEKSAKSCLVGARNRQRHVWSEREIDKVMSGRSGKIGKGMSGRKVAPMSGRKNACLVGKPNSCLVGRRCASSRSRPMAVCQFAARAGFGRTKHRLRCTFHSRPDMTTWLLTLLFAPNALQKSRLLPAVRQQSPLPSRATSMLANTLDCPQLVRAEKS